MYNTSVQTPFPLAAKMPNSVRDRGKERGEWRERERETDIWSMLNWSSIDKETCIQTHWFMMVLHLGQPLLSTSLHVPPYPSLPVPQTSGTMSGCHTYKVCSCGFPADWLLAVVCLPAVDQTDKPKDTKTLPKSSTAPQCPSAKLARKLKQI